MDQRARQHDDRDERDARARVIQIRQDPLADERPELEEEQRLHHRRQEQQQQETRQRVADHSRGAVRDRSQVFNPANQTWTKRDTGNGRFMDQKKDGEPFKGVRKEPK